MSELAVSQLSTYHWSLERDLVQYEAAGYSSIGVWRRKIDDLGEEAAIDLLHESKLAVSSLSWAGGFTQADELRTIGDIAEDARNAVRLASRLRAQYLLLHPGGRGGYTHRHVLRIFREQLTPLAEFAHDLDVKLALEPMHPVCAGDWTTLTSYPAAVDLIDSLKDGADNVRIVLDAYHTLHDESLWEALPGLLPYIGLVQVADRANGPTPDQQRCLPETGSLPVRQFVLTLQNLGYRGPIELEVFGEAVEDAGYEHCLRRGKEFLDGLID
jgi:sugar phosphate isomerase/epimerase